MGMLLDNIGTGIAIVRLQSLKPFVWTLLHINSLAAALVGRSGRGLFSDGIGLNVPEAPHKMEALFASAVRSGKVHVLGRLAYQRTTDSTHYFMTKVIPLDANTVAVTFEDMTDYENSRRGLNAAEARLREVAEAGIITWRADPHSWTFSFISTVAQTVLGYWPERWTGERGFFMKRLHPDDREMVKLLCTKSFDERRAVEFECRFLTAGEGVKHFRTAVRPVPAGYDRWELSGMMIDITAIREAEAKAHELSAQILQAQDDEQRRISRELHDSVGQYLSAAKMTLKILERNEGGAWEKRDHYLNQCDVLIEQAVREVRTVSYLLHPPLLDEVGLASALKWLAEGLSDRSGIRLDVDVPDEMKRLAPHVEMALFRIAQEALTNVHRHSRSDYASLRLKIADSSIALEIEDHGVGLPADLAESIRIGHASGGVGLRGMHERAKELSGRLEVAATERGTIVRAVVPLKLGGAAQGNGIRPIRKSANGDGAAPPSAMQARSSTRARAAKA